jgi:hypothetical protein
VPWDTLFTMPRALTPFPLICLVLLFAGCGSSAAPLTNTHASADAVATAVLRAYAARDRAALERLALSESEFRGHVWPELPAARPERNLPFSYVWGDLRQKSEQTLAGLLAEHGGHRYELVAVTFASSTPSATYTVHREATFKVRDAEGQERDLRLCGSFLEKDGHWKVFSYVVND